MATLITGSPPGVKYLLPFPRPVIITRSSDEDVAGRRRSRCSGFEVA
eukprot:CAMPEP_0182587066 /NCGR_PEP_ID=MMETSP1324-20130603/64208_1 /TAXON_ID=236786 /ORGANISM="Florenciella sp., Strain RCC1587" /LENGTH=46 /DNA_ID= /DNA_START= /DNA_END= /DNA_ORIENTATION=